MAEHENFHSLKLFRRMGKVILQTDDGKALKGRGIITALRQTTGEPGDVRHELGALDRPLYRFLGWLPNFDAAGVLVQAEKAYRILDKREVLLGERIVAVRMLLKRRDENADNRAVG